MRFDASAHNATVATHSGVYFGTFFCMNGAWPLVTLITDNGRSRSSGRIRSWTCVEVVDEVTLRRAGTVEQRLVEVGQLDPVARLVAARAGHQRSVSRTIGRSGLRLATSVNPNGSNIDGVPV